MKKLFSLLILTTAMLAVAFSFVSCKKEEPAAQPEPHVHTEGTAVRENEVQPTCTKAGSYELATYCTECKEELSREEKTIKANGHKAADAVTENTVEGNCTTNATHQEVVYCDVCDYEMSRKTIVDKKAEGHISAGAVTEKFDATCTGHGHTDRVEYCKNCPEVLSRKEISYDALPLGHKPMDAVIPTEGQYAYVPNSCCSAGYYWEFVYCERCDEEIDRTKTDIPTRAHTPSETVAIENEVEATCVRPDSHEEVTYCAECGRYEFSRVTVYGEKLVHSGTYNVKEGYVNFTCKTNGGYYSVDYCKDCNLMHNKEWVTIKAHCVAADPVIVDYVEPDAESKLDGHYYLVTYCKHCKEEIEDTRITMIIPYDGSDEYIYKGEKE